jgi:hypothetical protein
VDFTEHQKRWGPLLAARLSKTTSGSGGNLKGEVRGSLVKKPYKLLYGQAGLTNLTAEQSGL